MTIHIIIVLFYRSFVQFLDLESSLYLIQPTWYEFPPVHCCYRNRVVSQKIEKEWEGTHTKWVGLDEEKRKDYKNFTILRQRKLTFASTGFTNNRPRPALKLCKMWWTTICKCSNITKECHKQFES